MSFDPKTDGNIAALRAYEREQDAIDRAEQALEDARNELSEGLFDAYIEGDSDVIDEVDDYLSDREDLLELIRAALAKECEKPIYKRGQDSYEALCKIVSKACDSIAGRCNTVEEVEDFRL